MNYITNMDNMGVIFMIMLAAVSAEHYIFVKILGVSPFARVSEKPAAALQAGIGVTLLMSAALTAGYFGIIAFIPAAVFLIWGAQVLMKKYSPKMHRNLSVYVFLLMINSAVLCAVLIGSSPLRAEEGGFDITGVAAYGVFSVIGFTLVIIMFTGIRERLRFANPPSVLVSSALKEMPIVAAAAVLLAMAFAAL